MGITTKINTKVAADSFASSMHIHVDTNINAVIWLSGNTKTMAEVDQASSIAKATEGVKFLRNDIQIKKDI
jgi:osmotically-inducible protein OsmY